MLKLTILIQSKIGGMADLNQRIISEYLNGKYISEISQKLIYKWYLRYSKNPEIYQQAKEEIIQQAFDKIFKFQ